MSTISRVLEAETAQVAYAKRQKFNLAQDYDQENLLKQKWFAVCTFNDEKVMGETTKIGSVYL